MEFNFQAGEIWSAGTVDDATLQKMQAIALRLHAKLVTEDGEFFDIEEPALDAPREPLTRGRLSLRIYTFILVIVAVVFYFLQR